jgi:hypothetical protein
MNAQAIPTSILRPLDGIERAFWLLDQNMPTNFCIAAEVIGRTPPIRHARAGTPGRHGLDRLLQPFEATFGAGPSQPDAV